MDLALPLPPPPAVSFDQAAGRRFVVSAAVDDLSLDQAIAQVVRGRRRRASRVTHVVDAHALALAVSDQALRGALARADLVLGAGRGVRVGAALAGTSLRGTLDPDALVPGLLRAVATLDQPILLIGAGAKAAAQRLRVEHPGVRLPMVHDGKLGVPASRVLARRIAAIAGKGPCVVVVALGAGRQERFVWDFVAELPGVNAITVPGALAAEVAPPAPTRRTSLLGVWARAAWQRVRG